MLVLSLAWDSINRLLFVTLFIEYIYYYVLFLEYFKFNMSIQMVLFKEYKNISNTRGCQNISINYQNIIEIIFGGT